MAKSILFGKISGLLGRFGLAKGNCGPNSFILGLLWGSVAFGSERKKSRYYLVPCSYSGNYQLVFHSCSIILAWQANNTTSNALLLSKGFTNRIVARVKVRRSWLRSNLPATTGTKSVTAAKGSTSPVTSSSNKTGAMWSKSAANTDLQR